MCKRLILGDVHVHLNTVQDIYYKENPDEVIILGDYVDGFGKTPEDSLNCLKGVLELQKLHRENKSGSFILLLGNHELHYLVFGEQYSGFNPHTYELCHSILKENLLNNNIQLIQVDYTNNIIFSHAGITNMWYEKQEYKSLADINVIKSIEDLNPFKFRGLNIYGDDPNNGPLWVRPSALGSDPLEGWKQVVGHTHFKYITEFRNTIFLDTLPSQYLIQYVVDGILESTTYKFIR